MRRLTSAKARQITFHFPYNQPIINRIKAMNRRRYDASNRSWIVTLDNTNAFESERICKEFDFLMDKNAKEQIDLVKKEAKEMVQAAKQEIKQLEVPKTLTGTLRPYQIEGLSYMVHKKKAMNGCEPGLGKTIQTIAALEYDHAYPCLVVVPASLKYNWEEEFEKWLPNRSSLVLFSDTLIYSDKEVYIINYDILKKKQKDLEKIAWKSIVFDESQYIKNKDSQRSKASKELSQNINIRYCLSGTAIENRPSELINQLEILDKLDDFGGWYRFVTRYCDAKRGAYGFEIDGSSNLKELHTKMKGSFYFRRNKKDVLKDLPPKQRQMLRIGIPNMKEYEKAEADPISYLQKKMLKDEKFIDELYEMTEEEKIDYIAEKMKGVADKVSAAEQLVAVNALRQLTSEGKVPAAIEWIKDFLESGKKLVVFCEYRKTADDLADYFKCDKIVGGVSAKKKNDAKNRFQNDPDVNLIVCNIVAGGVGLTLTASSDVLFVDQNYVPAKITQAEDRCHRITQENSVNIYTMVAIGTIDVDVYSLVQEKLLVVDAVNAGEFEDGMNGDSVIKELMMKYFRNS